ncbi:hypothetical protein J8F10_36435 [Gemmata sp. G18]|uniref:DUF4129 domain-containing protein n=1 Tax=Gemmata palustris TaxID=2822762 RepID=A0ABS5C436_9BACT|nr:hypothetical protein [Gemmata palustris]MBP3960742.1 hypothetical protein [Gemmata palustris]
MPDEWVAVVVMLSVAAALGVVRLAVARGGRAVTFANEREEQLTRRLASRIGCSLADALPAVRNEIRHGPNQTDETLLKRAEYHYRQNLPEHAPCRVYRDRAPR